MNFQHLEALYWIGRLGGFHAAARHLRTSQPAISGRIRDLERELGVTLFDRSQRRVRPTPQGEDLLRYAAQILALTEEVRRRVGPRESEAGRVRFGVTGTAALTWARRLVGRLAATHPGIDVDLTVETSEVLAEQMEAGELDLAVMAGPLESTRVTSEILGRVAMSWLASPGLALPVGPIAASAVAAHPIIVDRPGTKLHAAATAWFRAEGCEPRRQHACSSLGIRIQLAAQGLGIALAAASAAARELEEGRLRVLATARAAPAIEYVIAHPGLGLSPAARIVAETARLLIAQKPDLESYYAATERLIQWNDDTETVIGDDKPR